MHIQYEVGDKVRTKTDTVFDIEGVPVSVRVGCVGRVVEHAEGWVQFLVKCDCGPELFGLPEDRVERITL